MKKILFVINRNQMSYRECKEEYDVLRNFFPVISASDLPHGKITIGVPHTDIMIDIFYNVGSTDRICGLRPDYWCSDVDLRRTPAWPIAGQNLVSFAAVINKIHELISQTSKLYELMSQKPSLMVPAIDWKPFNKDDIDTYPSLTDGTYLVLIEDDEYDGEEMGFYNPNHTYFVDIATPYGTYIDNFWDTEIDWDEGQNLKVLAYAEIPFSTRIEHLIRKE